MFLESLCKHTFLNIRLNFNIVSWMNRDLNKNKSSQLQLLIVTIPIFFLSNFKLNENQGFFLSLKVVLKDWSVHVSDLRDSHSSLNFFTTDQLVLLSEQMAKVVYKDSKLSVEAVMLLRLIGPGKVELSKHT